MKHDYKKQGKANRAAGKRFELKVRENLENQGWIVFRNSNDVELILKQTNFKTIKKENENSIEFSSTFNEQKLGRFKQAKTKWNPFTKMPMSIQSGFPDFVCIFRRDTYFDVQFVECKVNGMLSKIERDKVEWIKTNLKIPVLVARRGLKRGEIIYQNE
jgi:hypothetical protein